MTDKEKREEIKEQIEKELDSIDPIECETCRFAKECYELTYKPLDPECGKSYLFNKLIEARMKIEELENPPESIGDFIDDYADEDD